MGGRLPPTTKKTTLYSSAGPLPRNDKTGDGKIQPPNTATLHSLSLFVGNGLAFLGCSVPGNEEFR